MSTKVCIVCGEEKPLEAFSNHAETRDGKRNQCKPCKAAAMSPDARRERQRRKRANAHAETSALATNSYKEWTSSELELAADLTLTARQVAITLGRTQSAVVNQRHLMKKEKWHEQREHRR